MQIGWRTTACLTAWMLAGCTSAPEVRHLATGRSDVLAHELTGGDLDTLRRTAQRLCPLGGEIQRQSGQNQRQAVASGWWRETRNGLAEWADPPKPTAQMVVLCREPAERSRLQTATSPSTAAAASEGVQATEATAVAPVGPITVEW